MANCMICGEAFVIDPVAMRALCRCGLAKMQEERPAEPYRTATQPTLAQAIEAFTTAAFNYGFAAGAELAGPEEFDAHCAARTALLSAIAADKAALVEALAKWMIENGFATGDGDDIAGLLGELAWQIGEIREHRDNARESLRRNEARVREAGDWLRAFASVDIPKTDNWDEGDYRQIPTKWLRAARTAYHALAAAAPTTDGGQTCR